MSTAQSNDEDPTSTRPGMQTRRSNKDAHPGYKAMELLSEGLPAPPKRRTSAQVQADNAAKASAKAAAQAEMEERIAKVARIEEEIEKDDNETASSNSKRRGGARGGGRGRAQRGGGKGRGRGVPAAEDAQPPQSEGGQGAKASSKGRGQAGIGRGARVDVERESTPMDDDREEESRTRIRKDRGAGKRARQSEEDVEDNMSVDLPELPTNLESARSDEPQAQTNSQLTPDATSVTAVNPVLEGAHKVKTGRISIRDRVADMRKKLNDPSAPQVENSTGEKISAWRQSVEPGGDHVSDISEPASKTGSARAVTVRPTDSASCVPSPESSVLSSTNQKGSRDAAPPASTVSGAGSVTMSVNIMPPTPKKEDIHQRSALANGRVSIFKRDASESLRVADSVVGTSRRSRSRSASGTREGKSKFTNKDLPFDLGSEKIWRSVFCVTMFEYMGLQDDPWSLSVEIIEDIWAIVLKHLDYQIKQNGPVYYVISQRLCEWRGKFARCALTVVEKHFESEEFKTDDNHVSPQKIAGYVEHMIEETEHGYRFIYADTANQKSCFRQAFIAETLAVHLQSIDGSVGLSEIFEDDPDSLHPRGALILTCVAVLRALKLYKTGVCPSHLGDFSGDQVEADRGYFAEFIDMKAAMWAKVLQEAQKFVPTGSRRSSSRPKPAVATTVRKAVLREDSDED